MRVERGQSQILFGMLPSQTVDLQGGVWRVREWPDPQELSIDQGTLRNGLLEAIKPWEATGKDDGLANDLRGGARVQAVSVNRHMGVVVEPYPRQWRCRTCNRITTQRVDRCRCGSTSLAQMQFVAYHTCGAVKEPMLPRCPTHGGVAVRLPGTATSRELYFYCPDCNRSLSQGFPFQRCECGNGVMSITVHRASVVFTPHFAVLVNPPDPAAAARNRAMGGGARALEWLLSGMGPGAPADEGRQTVEGFVEALLQQRISLETAQELARTALERGDVVQGSAGGDLRLPDVTRQRAQEEALSLISAVSGGRVRIGDMVGGTTPPLRTLYDSSYRRAMQEARLTNVELLTNFPVATLAFGHTRGSSDPGQTRLVTFRDRGTVRAYGALSRTEALLFQLDPLAVHCHLMELRLNLEPAATEREARLAILRSIEVPYPTEQHPQPLGGQVVTLLHSYAHRLIRVLAGTAGIERDALAEYLLPHHLSIIVYASARGEFVLGGLQAVFETALDQVLDDFVRGEHRCPLDPGCRSGGGACMACLHLGEPSCRWFNRLLDRSVLFGERGFFRSACGE